MTSRSTNAVTSTAHTTVVEVTVFKQHRNYKERKKQTTLHRLRNKKHLQNLIYQASISCLVHRKPREAQAKPANKATHHDPRSHNLQRKKESRQKGCPQHSLSLSLSLLSLRRLPSTINKNNGQ